MINRELNRNSVKKINNEYTMVGSGSYMCKQKGKNLILTWKLWENRHRRRQFFHPQHIFPSSFELWRHILLYLVSDYKYKITRLFTCFMIWVRLNCFSMLKKKILKCWWYFFLMKKNLNHIEVDLMSFDWLYESKNNSDYL